MWMLQSISFLNTYFCAKKVLFIEITRKRGGVKSRACSPPNRLHHHHPLIWVCLHAEHAPAPRSPPSRRRSLHLWPKPNPKLNPNPTPKPNPNPKPNPWGRNKLQNIPTTSDRSTCLVSLISSCLMLVEVRSSLVSLRDKRPTVFWGLNCKGQPKSYLY